MRWDDERNKKAVASLAVSSLLPRGESEVKWMWGRLGRKRRMRVRLVCDTARQETVLGWVIWGAGTPPHHHHSPHIATTSQLSIFHLSIKNSFSTRWYGNYEVNIDKPVIFSSQYNGLRQGPYLNIVKLFSFGKFSSFKERAISIEKSWVTLITIKNINSSIIKKNPLIWLGVIFRNWARTISKVITSICWEWISFWIMEDGETELQTRRPSPGHTAFMSFFFASLRMVSFNLTELKVVWLAAVAVRCGR